MLRPPDGRLRLFAVTGGPSPRKAWVDAAVLGAERLALGGWTMVSSGLSGADAAAAAAPLVSGSVVPLLESPSPRGMEVAREMLEEMGISGAVSEKRLGAMAGVVDQVLFSPKGPVSLVLCCNKISHGLVFRSGLEEFGGHDSDMGMFVSHLCFAKSVKMEPLCRGKTRLRIASNLEGFLQ